MRLTNPGRSRGAGAIAAVRCDIDVYVNVN